MMNENNPILKSELRVIHYRGREVEINFHFYHDSELGINYTTTEIDEINWGVLRAKGGE